MVIRIIAILIALAGLAFVIYLLFGKNQKPWDQMTEDEQKRKKTLVAGGIIVFLAGILSAIFLGRKKQ